MLREILTQLANALPEEGAIDERESFIDVTVTTVEGGGDAVGLTERGKGLKILAIVDRHGLPLSVSTHAANHHEVTLVQLSFDFSTLEAKPGMTGLWQVVGRSRTTFDEMVRLDLRYARTMPLRSDIKILLATPAAMITGKGGC